MCYFNLNILNQCNATAVWSSIMAWGTIRFPDLSSHLQVANLQSQQRKTAKGAPISSITAPKFQFPARSSSAPPSSPSRRNQPPQPPPPWGVRTAARTSTYPTLTPRTPSPPGLPTTPPTTARRLRLLQVSQRRRGGYPRLHRRHRPPPPPAPPQVQRAHLPEP
jgi:hypothetical protein